MVTGLGKSASRQEAKYSGRRQSVEFIRPLRLIARQHKACYEIWPLSSISEEVPTSSGFELLLCGVNGHLRRESGALHPVADCQHCARSYAELRAIAEWIVPLKKPPLSYSIYSFDRALHVAPANRQHRSEIVITIEVLVEAYQQDHSEGECLKEVRERLYNLGIREDVWYAASGNTPVVL